MAPYMPALITAMAAGAVVLDIAVLGGVASLFGAGMRGSMRRFAQSYGLLAVLVLAVLSIAGTLLMQYAGALAPCVLCWWQRVFMYPIAFIAVVAFAKNARFSEIADYVLALSVVGFLIALYQHLLQILPSGTLIPCDASGDCAVRSIFEFGFVTIPWMALSVFAVLIVLSAYGRRSS